VVALLGLVTVHAVPTAPKASVRRTPISRGLSRAMKPTSNAARSVAPKAMDGMAGKVYDNVLFKQEAGWDPLNLAEGKPKEVINKYRDAELIHGRMAMAAVAGILMAEKFHPVFPEISGTAHEQLAAVFEKVPAFRWFALMHIWINEGLRLYKFDIEKRGGALKSGEVPGDYGYDPLNLMPKKPDAALVRQNQEINNGRLAMVASLGMIADEQITGQPIADKLIPL